MNSVNVYLLSIDKIGNKEIELCKNYFPDRYKKSERFAFREDKFRCIGVAALLHKRLNLIESDIRIGENGKPFSDNIKEEFSISHSGDYICLAVCNNTVGVDIEKIKKANFSVAKKIFTYNELNWMNENPDNRFYSLWTKKESFVKCIGDGITSECKKIDTTNNNIKYNNSNYYTDTVEYNGYMISCCCKDLCCKINIID